MATRLGRGTQSEKPSDYQSELRTSMSLLSLYRTLVVSTVMNDASHDRMNTTMRAPLCVENVYSTRFACR
jgi:hypothetical protein